MKKDFIRYVATILTLVMFVTLLPASTLKAAEAPGNYSYFDDYSIGWRNGIVAYQGGRQVSLQQVGAKVYNRYEEADNPFEAQVQQAWDEPNLTLTQPVMYTTTDGVGHPIENMLTNYDFIADPTAIDNSDVDGKLYVYGTTEGFSYGRMSRDEPEVTANPGDVLEGNRYQNHSLTILSTSDMVNWTDEGFMDSLNLTNLPSYDEAKHVKTGITSGPSWAPSGLKYYLEGSGKWKYYLFYTNGGATGYVMSDSPTGPWEDPEGTTIFSKSTPNCSDCSVCFDPAVLVDDKGDGYVYFGGLTRDSGRACKVLFDPVTGKVSRDGDPVKLPTYAMFEDNEINQFYGKYFYSYCTDYGSQSLTSNVSIAVYVSSDPLNVSFEPSNNRNEAFQPFTDSDGVYRHFLGTVLTNPSSIFGEGYNNHHHMQEFKDHKYILYHSTVLHNTLHHVNNQYRNLHVDEITVDPDTDAIEGVAVDERGNKTVATYEGPEQIEYFDPYKDFNGNEKYINATTASSSAGVKSTRDDDMVLNSKNGSPMVLDCIETGDWTRLQGVEFKEAPKRIQTILKSDTAEGAIEVFVDDPTVASNMVAKIALENTGSEYKTLSTTDVDGDKLNGVHDVYFVFRGNGYTVSSWKFSTTTVDPDPVVNPTPAPAGNQPTPDAPKTTPSEATVGSVNYKINADGTASVKAPANKNAKSVTIPESVVVGGSSYKVESIADNAFSGSKKLTTVVIPKGVKKIGKKAFFGCKSLKKIIVKSTSLKKVGKQALKGTAKKLVIKVPKKKLKAYKKLFKGKGQSKKAKIKK